MYKKMVVYVFVLFALGAGSVYAQQNRAGLTGTPVKAQTREEIRERLQTRAAELEEKLLQIKDRQRARLAQTVSERMCRVQSNWTREMTVRLEQMEKILDKVETRMKEAQTNGKNISSVEPVLASARAKVANVLSMTKAQQDKDCGLVISGDETKLRIEAKVSYQQLKSDLSALSTEVKNARELTRQAIVALAQALGEGGEND